MYDIKDERGVPVSAGIPPIVRWSAIIGVLIIILILGLCVASSHYHHVWPAKNTVDIKLD
ncbi:MAG: hypothetical protein WCE44_11905 [Candidatus Velthaea sp.]|jgi:hypothetical protein